MMIQHSRWRHNVCYIQYLYALLNNMIKFYNMRNIYTVACGKFSIARARKISHFIGQRSY